MVTSLCQLCAGNSGALFKKWFYRIQTRLLYACWLLRYVLRVMVRICFFGLLNIADYSHLSHKMDA